MVQAVLTGWSTVSGFDLAWLGHMTRKIVLEMTYNVSSGTLNTTIPYIIPGRTRRTQTQVTET